VGPENAGPQQYEPLSGTVV